MGEVSVAEILLKPLEGGGVHTRIENEPGSRVTPALHVAPSDGPQSRS
jgi:hypothetical protein